jgi:hypothetical protein
MFKALAFKEWLKIRWTFLGLAAVSFAMIVYIFMDISHGIELNGAMNYWGYIIYRKIPLAYDISYLPFITGVIIALVQFYPEINEGRLKLTLHLPVKENKILFLMVAFGGGLFILLSAINLLLVWVFSLSYFPSEVAGYAVWEVIPSYLAGIIAYLAVASIMVEPLWNRRIPQIIFCAGLISVPLASGDYSPLFILFFILTGVMMIFNIFLSGFYFKRGIK